ncbi:hypothetical protein RJ55_05563 [Drechmeria coniospora]|nr:hypothetical protein RJ55_05563 [Drechmeria coniospora]
MLAIVPYSSTDIQAKCRASSFFASPDDEWRLRAWVHPHPRRASRQGTRFSTESTDKRMGPLFYSHHSTSQCRQHTHFGTTVLGLSSILRYKYCTCMRTRRRAAMNMHGPEALTHPYFLLPSTYGHTARCMAKPPGAWLVGGHGPGDGAGSRTSARGLEAGEAFAGA